MESLAIVGMSLGTMGFLFGMSALVRVSSLEKQLRDGGLLKKKPGTS